MDDLKEIIREVRNMRHELKALTSKVEQKHEDEKPSVVLHMRQIKQRLNYGSTWFENHMDWLIREVPIYRTKNTGRYWCREKDLEEFISKKL